MNGMGGQGQAPSPGGMTQPPRKRMMMHMTFFWGHDTLVLFDGWPGQGNLGMYWLCLAVIFIISLASEWLSHSPLLRRHGPSSLGLGISQSLLYTVRTGLSYLVMLAVMSFNGGVFLAAMAGFGLGFLLFGSRAFRDTAPRNVTDFQSHC